MNYAEILAAHDAKVGELAEARTLITTLRGLMTEHVARIEDLEKQLYAARVAAPVAAAVQGDALIQKTALPGIVANALAMVDGCMDITQVEVEDAAAWQIVRKHFLAQRAASAEEARMAGHEEGYLAAMAEVDAERAASQPDSERDAALTDEQITEAAHDAGMRLHKAETTSVATLRRFIKAMAAQQGVKGGA